jgi:hypothetical protein
MPATLLTFNLRHQESYRILASQLDFGNAVYPQDLTGSDFSSQIIITPENGSFDYTNRGLTSDVILRINKLGQDPSNYLLVSLETRDDVFGKSFKIAVSSHEKHSIPNYKSIYGDYDYNAQHQFDIETPEDETFRFLISASSITTNDVIRATCEFYKL